MSTQCKTPFTVKMDNNTKGKHTIAIPCGTCPYCLKRRASGWSIRLAEHERISDNAWFITLTYANQFLQFSSNGFRTLCKRDVQLFIKRLRKRTHGNKKGNISYYACGEYGAKFGRPHYHLLMFNVKWEDIEKAWSIDGIPIGGIYYGTCTNASAGYVLKYMQKGRWKKKHKNDDRVPEFQLCSKGIGKSYVSPAIIRWHKANLETRCYYTTRDGKKVSLPRYLKNLIYTPEEREVIGNYIQQEVDKKTQEYVEDNQCSLTEQDQERIKARFRNANIIANRGRSLE